MTIASLLRNSRISFSNFRRLGWSIALNVNVADATVGQFIDLLAALFHPAFITKGRIGLAVDSFNASFPGAFLARLVIKGDFDFAIKTIVEQCPVFVTSLNGLPANRDQIIADVHLHPVFVGRAIFVDIRNAVATCSLIGLEIEPETGGGDAAAPNPRGGGAAPVCDAFSSPIISLMMFSNS